MTPGKPRRASWVCRWFGHADRLAMWPRIHSVCVRCGVHNYRPGPS